MTMYDKRLIEQAKVLVDLRVLVEELHGAPQDSATDHNKYLCFLPGHTERTPSLAIYQDHYFCYGSCQQGGDHIQLLMDVFNWNFQEAAKFLLERAGLLAEAERQQPTIPQQKTEAPKHKVEPVFELDLVEGYTTNLTKSWPYITHRRWTMHASRNRWGVVPPDDFWGGGFYRLDEGEIVKLPVGPNYISIPHIVRDRVYKIALRRDDFQYAEFVQSVEKGLVSNDVAEDIVKVMAHAQERLQRPLGLQEVLALMYKSKKQIKGGHDVFYNTEIIYNSTSLPYLIVVEGQGDVAALETELGLLNVISGKANSYNMEHLAPAIRSKAKFVLIVADHDENSAGLDYALKLQGVLNHPNCVIEFPPDGCKDLNDAIMKGKADAIRELVPAFAHV